MARGQCDERRRRGKGGGGEVEGKVGTDALNTDLTKMSPLATDIPMMASLALWRSKEEAGTEKERLRSGR